MINQLQRREGQRRGAIALGSGYAVDDPLRVDQMETFEREGRAGTVAQPPLQARAILSGNPHLGVQRESAVLPSEHLADVITVDQAAAGEPSQHPSRYLLADSGDGLWCQLRRGLEAHGAADTRSIVGALEHVVDDATVGPNLSCGSIHRGANRISPNQARTVSPV